MANFAQFTHTKGMELLKQSKQLQKELVVWRRYLHEHAETGFALDKTCAFVEKKLKSFGYAPKKCGRAGVVATVGKEKTGKTFLLRADMDALPIAEETGLPYACKNGNMHACGHDMHTAALLGAAKLLKSREDELHGQVKLLFQPAEELLEGASDVIEAGVLDSPKMQAALALHVMTATELPTGTAVVASAGVGAPAADFFSIEVQGKGCHGSAPWNGVDALLVAAHIVIALQALSAREISVSDPFVLTMGALNAGKTGNVIPDKAVLKGTLRAFDEGVRTKVKKRMEEIAKGVAKTFRASVKIVYAGGCPTLINDEKLSIFMEKVTKELLGEENVFTSAELSKDAKTASGGSEDFAYISQKIPSQMVALAAGERGQVCVHPLHHPKVRFDEGALFVGAAIYAKAALAWLGNE